MQRESWVCNRRVGVGICLFLLSALCAGCPGTATPQGAAEPESFFTLVVLPDTQYYSAKYPETFDSQVRWIRQNAAKENIVFVSHLGDVVDAGAKDPVQYLVADAAMSCLDGVVPWAIAIGNHDYDRPGDPNGAAAVFLRYFGPQRFDKCDWFGGASADGLDSYQVFAGCGMKFLILHLQCDAPDASLRWADGVLRQHPRLPAILTTHAYIDDKIRGRTKKPWFRAGGNSGDAIWAKFVSKQPQVFLVLCGHHGDKSGLNGEWRQVSRNEAGQDVQEVLSDYQFRANGGDGWLRIMRFAPARDEIQVRTYSPTLDRYLTGPNSQFTLPFDAARWRVKAATSPPERVGTGA